MGIGNDSLRIGVESQVDLVTGCICHESVECHSLPSVAFCGGR